MKEPCEACYFLKVTKTVSENKILFLWDFKRILTHGKEKFQ